MTDSTPRQPLDDLAATVSRAVAGQFALERVIGRGGMGVVYLARDLKLDRHAALKVLPANLAEDPVVRERFLREARTAGRLAHPNIVPVFRADELQGVAFFAMAFVDGESLAERLRDRGPMTSAEGVAILREVAWALAYAHARGVVHRDVKPENIMLERGTGRALVTDFGIARRDEPILPDAERLTQDGHVLGTLHYMSPEQVSGATVDGRSDLYSLGVVAYQTLSGRLPFADLEGTAVAVAHATREPPPLRSVAPNVPATLAAVIDRCLQKRPDDRFATGEALADALERALATAPAAARVIGPALPDGLPPVVSESQATGIWRRAAQLQAEALRRLEERHDLLPPTSATPAASGASLTSGLRLADVAAAAEEAGISRQYVAMALAELPRGALDVAAAAPVAIGERQSNFFLGTDQRSLGVSYVVPAPPARTLRTLGVVLQQAPYELQLRETVGAHPLDGGVIVFDLTGRMMGMTGPSISQVNHQWFGTQQRLGARQLQVTLRALPTDPNRTEVTMTCDLRPGVHHNVRASQLIGGLVGVGGGLFSTLVMAKVAALAGAALLGPAAGVAAVFAAGSLAAYRRLYPHTLGSARDEMLRALQAVAAAVQSEEVFGALPGPGRAHRGAGSGDAGSSAAGAIIASR